MFLIRSRDQRTLARTLLTTLWQSCRRVCTCRCGWSMLMFAPTLLSRDVSPLLKRGNPSPLPHGRRRPTQGWLALHPMRPDPGGLSPTPRRLAPIQGRPALGVPRRGCCCCRPTFFCRHDKLLGLQPVGVGGTIQQVTASTHRRAARKRGFTNGRHGVAVAQQS